MGFPYGTLDVSEHMARRLHALASGLRRQADAHELRGRAARWVSASADAFRDRVAADRRRIHDASGELDRAAAILLSRARRVRDTAGLLTRSGRDLVGWLERTSRLGAVPILGGGDTRPVVQARAVGDPARDTDSAEPTTSTVDPDA